MLQRLQTIYFLTSLLVIGIGYVNFDDGLSGPSSKLAVGIFSDQFYYVTFFRIAFSVSFLLTLINIFLFKNRELQLKLCKLTSLVNFLMFGFSIYLLLTLSGEISFSEKGIWIIGSTLLSVLLLFLASKSIKKDDDLVKSIDRLR